MLDELGNLQSEGHGISGFETMLSIGLGQEQQFSATCWILKRYSYLMILNITLLSNFLSKVDKSATCIIYLYEAR